MKNPALYFIVAVVLGGLGSIVFGSAPLIGGILIAIGVLGSIWSFVASNARSKQGDYLFDAQALLLARHGLGNIYANAVQLELEKTGSSKNARRYLLKALDVEPNNIDALSMLCPILALELSFLKWMKISSKEDRCQDTFNLAKKLTERGLAIDPDSNIFHDVSGILYDFEGKHDNARREYAISSLSRTDPYWHLLLATSWGMSGEHAKGLSEMEKARDKGACGWLFEFYYGRALQAVGEYERAVNHLEKSIKQARWKIEILDYLSGTHNYQANILKAAKYKGLAVIAIITLSPKAGFKYLLEFLLLFGTGIMCKFSKSIWRLTRFIPLIRGVQLKFFPPYDPEYSIGSLLIEKKHFAAAEKMLRRASSTVPEEGKIHSNMATCLALQGKKEKALESIDRAIALDPKNQHIYSWNKEQIMKNSHLRVRMLNEVQSGG